MNRRTFLQTAGAASLAPIILTTRKSTAQSGLGLDPGLVQACSNAHALALSNLWAGTPTADDWYGVIGAHYNLRAAVQDNYLDPAFSGSVPDSVDTTYIDITPATLLVQQFQPSFGYYDMLGIYDSQVSRDPVSVARACQGLQQTGLSGLCTSVIRDAMVMAQAVSSSGDGMQFTHVPGTAPRPWNCMNDGAALFFTTTALTVLTVMVGPAGVLAMGFWEPFVLWGGIGAGAWGAGHALVCSF